MTAFRLATAGNLFSRDLSSDLSRIRWVKGTKPVKNGPKVGILTICPEFPFRPPGICVHTPSASYPPLPAHFSSRGGSEPLPTASRQSLNTCTSHHPPSAYSDTTALFTYHD